MTNDDRKLTPDEIALVLRAEDPYSLGFSEQQVDLVLEHFGGEV